jgi:hypothetical protein
MRSQEVILMNVGKKTENAKYYKALSWFHEKDSDLTDTDKKLLYGIVSNEP